MRDAQICECTDNIEYFICTRPDVSIPAEIIVCLIIILAQEIPADGNSFRDTGRVSDSRPQKTCDDRDITGRDDSQRNPQADALNRLRVHRHEPGASRLRQAGGICRDSKSLAIG
jgi:hypothetical protein